MTKIPRERSPDSSVALLREGYTFISKRCRRHQSDIFRMRFLFEDTLCMSGPDAAAAFYDQDYFVRAGAAPRRAQKTLFEQGGAQGLDGENHRARKAMFMSLMTRERIVELADRVDEEWRSAASRWEKRGRIVLFPELEELLCRAVCAWAGLSLDEPDIQPWTRALGTMIDGVGGVGPRYWRARRARGQAEQWAERHIAQARAEDAGQDEPRALEVIAAHALHQHPSYREPLASGEAEHLERFVQEVRRFYPFFPFAFAFARIARPLEWNGYHLPQGPRVLLDLYGINHDARIWSDPEQFRPERFRDWVPDAFQMIPQGGADHYQHHRCAGEWITIEIMKTALRQLTGGMRYDVPRQDLTISLTRAPAIPASRMIIDNVRRIDRSQAYSGSRLAAK